MKTINKDMVFGEILRVEGGITPILMNQGMHCLGCLSSQTETIEEACADHGLDAGAIIEEVNEYLAEQGQ